MRGLDWRGWTRLVSIGLILLALLSYLRALDVRRQPVPLVPLRVPAGFASQPSLPLAPGALRGQSLVLVTLDTIRPDRLGVYGNSEIETPNLDGLAARGVVFTRATATAPTTLPSHASILTGLYPIHHGARSNGQHRVRQDAVTLAERASPGQLTRQIVEQGWDLIELTPETLSLEQRYLEATTSGGRS